MLIDDIESIRADLRAEKEARKEDVQALIQVRPQSLDLNASSTNPLLAYYT